MLDNAAKPYNVRLIPARIQSKSVIKNMARFYVYELSRYSGEDIPENGLFKAHEDCFNYDRYWREAGHHPFIIRVDDHLAGFALVNKQGTRSEVDWHLAEFFILASFQKKGIGRQVAGLLLNQFSGVWEVAQMPNNLPAIHFWRSVIQPLTNGQYTEVQQQVKHPHPHEMVIQHFISPAPFT